MIRVFFIINLIFLTEINGIRRRCINTGIPFSDQILRSPVIVYGESISKRTYIETHTELLFNITFRVDCILKGQDVENQIEITEAGIRSGHMSCQGLEPGHYYVVFLEKWGVNKNGYRPLDIHERLVDNTTSELLTKTCHLTRVPPLQSTIDKCPNVSWIGYCPHDAIDMNIIPKQKYSDEFSPNIRSSYFNNEDQFHLQTNVSIPNEPIGISIRGSSINAASLSTISSLLIIIILILLS